MACFAEIIASHGGWVGAEAGDAVISQLTQHGTATDRCTAAVFWRKAQLPAAVLFSGCAVLTAVCCRR